MVWQLPLSVDNRIDSWVHMESYSIQACVLLGFISCRVMWQFVFVGFVGFFPSILGKTCRDSRFLVVS